MDFLRGIAALAVLIWHYQHFFYPQAGVGIADRSIQPLYNSLRYLYDYGGQAVQFFWILSGFVFFHAYQARELVSFREFFVNRFSRLYPLHLVTLLLVAALQKVSEKALGHHQIYPLNDLYHFALNLFMISHWGLQNGWSFNAPIWSVSVEIVIYGFFFAFIKSLRIHLLSAIAWFIFAWVAFNGMSSTNVFSQCTLLFILGGIVHQLHTLLSRCLDELISIVLASALLAISLYELYTKEVWSDFLGYYGLFPALIWFCASLDNLGISTGKVGRFFGNVTYASYLIHIPIQIAIMITLDMTDFDRFSIVATPTFLLSFLVTVFLLSHLIFKYIESPLKQAVRNLFTTQSIRRPVL